MGFRLFDFLVQSIPKGVENTVEENYFDMYKAILDRYESTHRFSSVETPFDLIKSCVVIRALRNMERLESFSILLERSEKLSDESIEAVHSGLEFFEFNGTRIFIPVFDQQLNARYDSRLSTISEKTRRTSEAKKDFDSSYVDLFLTYGLPLFESGFTTLIPICKQDNQEAFLSLSFDSIFVISDQGTLECTIPLIDKYLEEPDRSNMIQRATNLMKPYFEFDREGFIDSLRKNGFISNRLAKEIRTRSQASKAKHSAEA